MQEKRKVIETSEERERSWIEITENSIVPIYNIEGVEWLKNEFEPKFAVLNEQSEFIEIKKQLDSKLLLDDKSFEWSNVYKIDSICNRLAIIEEIIKIETIGTWGLCVYLYLTCFDSLGQKAKYTEFDNWINKKKNEKVSELICGSFESEDQTFKDLINKLYKSWKETFGVKNSFYNFMNTIEDSSEFKELLKSIEPISKIDEEELIDFKKSCLFYLRNNFTHNTKNHRWPTRGEDFWLPTTTIYKNKPRDMHFKVPRLLTPLKKCVLLGLIQSINQNILDV